MQIPWKQGINYGSDIRQMEDITHLVKEEMASPPQSADNGKTMAEWNNGEKRQSISKEETEKEMRREEQLRLLEKEGREIDRAFRLLTCAARPESEAFERAGEARSTKWNTDKCAERFD